MISRCIVRFIVETAFSWVDAICDRAPEWDVVGAGWGTWLLHGDMQMLSVACCGRDFPWVIGFVPQKLFNRFTSLTGAWLSEHRYELRIQA